MPSSQENIRSSKLMQPKAFSSKQTQKDEPCLSSNMNVTLSSNESIAAKNNQPQRMSRLKKPSTVTAQDKNKNLVSNHNGNMTQTKSCNSFNSINDSTNGSQMEEVIISKNSKLQKPSKLPATPGSRSSSAIAKLSLKPNKIVDNSFTNSENNLNCSPQRRFKSSERSLDSITDSNDKISTSMDINLNSQLPIFKRQVGQSKLIKPRNESSSNTSISKCKTPTEFFTDTGTTEIQMSSRKIKSPTYSSSSDHLITNINPNCSKLPLSNKKPESKLPAINCQVPKVLKTMPMQPAQNLSSTIQISLSPRIISKSENLEKAVEKSSAIVEYNSVKSYQSKIKEEDLKVNNITPMKPLGLQSPFLRMAKETLSNKNQNKLFLSTTTNKSTTELTGSSDSLEDILSSVAATDDTDIFDVGRNIIPHRKIITISGVKSENVIGDESKRNCEAGYGSDGDILSNSDKRISSGYISDGASSISDWMRIRSQNLTNADKCSLSNSDDASSIVSDQLYGQSVNNNTIISSHGTHDTPLVPKVNIQLVTSNFEGQDNTNVCGWDLDLTFNRSIKVRSTLPMRGKKAILPLDGFAQKSHQEFGFKNEGIAKDPYAEQRRLIKTSSIDSKSVDMPRVQTPDFDKTPTQKSLEESFEALKRFGRKGSLGASDYLDKNISFNSPANNKVINNVQTKEIIDAYISKYSKNNSDKKFGMSLHQCGSYPSDLLAQQSPLHQPYHHHLPKSPYSSLGRSAKLNIMRPPSFFTCGHVEPHQASPPKMSIKEDEAWNETNVGDLMRRRTTNTSQFLGVQMSPMRRPDSNLMYSSAHKSVDCACDAKDANSGHLQTSKHSKMGDSLNGSSLSLGSCSSLFSNVEDFNVHEIRRLRRELELAQTRVSSLNMQLNINENVVQAFEQSVANLNARLQCLTFLAGDKANHIGELQAAMNHIKNSRSFCSNQRSSINTDDDLLSESQDIEKKKKQKKWLTSIGKAFNRKKSKQLNESITDTASVIENDTKNENELIRQLEMRLQEREMKLTDAQLDALSSAHQLDLLRNAMSQMQREMMILKNDNNRLQQLISNKNIPSYTSDNKIDCKSFLRLSLYVRSSNSSELNKSSEILISNFFSEENTTWDLLEQNITKEFMDYLGYLDSTEKLGLSSKGIKSLSVGDLEWKFGTPPLNIAPSSRLVGLNQSISITLHGSIDNASDSLSFDMMLNRNVLQNFIDALSCQRIILLSSRDKVALTEFATKLAFYTLERFSDLKANVHRLDCLDATEVEKFVELGIPGQILFLENFHALQNNDIFQTLISISCAVIGATNFELESCNWLLRNDPRLFLFHLDLELHLLDVDQLMRFFRRNFIEFYAAQNQPKKKKVPTATLR